MVFAVKTWKKDENEEAHAEKLVVASPSVHRSGRDVQEMRRFFDDFNEEMGAGAEAARSGPTGTFQKLKIDTKMTSAPKDVPTEKSKKVIALSGESFIEEDSSEEETDDIVTWAAFDRPAKRCERDTS